MISVFGAKKKLAVKHGSPALGRTFVKFRLSDYRSFVLPDGPAARGATTSWCVIASRCFSRWSTQTLFASPSERHAKPDTHHEVVAARVGRFSIFCSARLEIGVYDH